MKNIEGIGVPEGISFTVTDGKGIWLCSCGAKAKPGDTKRFLKRHPALCSARQQSADQRKAFSKQLAQGVRCVDGAESDARIGLPSREDWDAIEEGIRREDERYRRERWGIGESR